MTAFRKASQAALLLLPLVLSACGDSGVEELRQWMADVKNHAPVAVQKLTAPKKFTPFTYDAKGNIGPFDSAKLSAALDKARDHAGGGLKPDLSRRREPLESYPLDSIRMVGILEKPGLRYAILQVDKAIYQAKAGNYVGPNFGMITGISDTEVNIKEIVQDASGEWVERKATLELQENKK
jgi:type IV pilus assembly protein PilP